MAIEDPQSVGHRGGETNTIQIILRFQIAFFHPRNKANCLTHWSLAAIVTAGESRLIVLRGHLPHVGGFASKFHEFRPEMIESVSFFSKIGRLGRSGCSA